MADPKLCPVQPEDPAELISLAKAMSAALVEESVEESVTLIPKLGACYNVWDGEELLEQSIRSVRAGGVEYVCVVWQDTSNFGEHCSRTLCPLLQRLHADGLIDNLCEYTPEIFSDDDKRRLVSPQADPQRDLGCTHVGMVSDVFFNELKKRELGRQLCVAANCTHFMPMDADEFYLADQLRGVLELAAKQDYEGIACRMRYLYHGPTHELLPQDDKNWVPILYACHEDLKFRLACPYPCLIDPTRKLHGVRRFHTLDRTECEMWHMSMVRSNLGRKLRNVSNRGNYSRNIDGPNGFVAQIERWKPGDAPIPHPHPFFAKLFQSSRSVPNHFNVVLRQQCAVCLKAKAKTCSACKLIRYCSVACQKLDIKRHRPECRKEQKRQAAALQGA